MHSLQFKSKEFGFEVVLPAQPEDVFDDEANDVKFFQISTRKANYGVIIKPIPKLVNQNELNNLYENMLAIMLDSETTKIISQKNVRIGDLSGKEIFYEKDSSKFFSRMFITENKLYIVSMIMDKKDYKTSFDKWALKFLDSFNLKVKIKNEGRIKQKKIRNKFQKHYDNASGSNYRSSECRQIYAF